MDFSKLAELMDHFVSWRIPGCSCVVYKDRKPVFRYSAGYSDVEAEKKMCGDEFMFMFSATKPIVCASALKLWEDGKLDIDAPVDKYLPEWRNLSYETQDENGNSIILPVPDDRRATVRNLFTMTAGLDYNTEFDELKAEIERTKPECKTLDICRAIVRRPLRFLPGEHWNYSLCHDILGAVIEVASGMPLADYVKKAILDPVGMKNTEFAQPVEPDKNMAIMYQFADEQDKYIRRYNQDNWIIFGTKYHSGGAGIVSTVSDMAMFAEMMSQGGVSQSGERVLLESTIEMMKTNQLTPEQMKDIAWGQLAGYGYGLGVRTMVDREKGNSPSPVGEFGWTGAAGAYMLIDTENKLSMFYAHHMTNNQEWYTAPRLRDTLYECIK